MIRVFLLGLEGIVVMLQYESFHAITHYRRENLNECLVSTRSKDGFGHQLEGKLSCLMVSYIHPRFTYIYLPFETMEHSAPGFVSEAESFLNLSLMLPTPASLNFTTKLKIISKI